MRSLPTSEYAPSLATSAFIALSPIPIEASGVRFNERIPPTLPGPQQRPGSAPLSTRTLKAGRSTCAFFYDKKIAVARSAVPTTTGLADSESVRTDDASATIFKCRYPSPSKRSTRFEFGTMLSSCAATQHRGCMDSPTLPSISCLRRCMPASRCIYQSLHNPLVNVLFYLSDLLRIGESPAHNSG